MQRESADRESAEKRPPKSGSKASFNFSGLKMAERDKLDIYTKGTICWFPDKENGYVDGILTDITITDTLVSMKFNINNNNNKVQY